MKDLLRFSALIALFAPIRSTWKKSYREDFNLGASWREGFEGLILPLAGRWLRLVWRGVQVAFWLLVLTLFAAAYLIGSSAIIVISDAIWLCAMIVGRLKVTRTEGAA